MENSWLEENNNTWKKRCKAILSAQVQWNAAKLVDNNLEQSQGFCISIHHAKHALRSLKTKKKVTNQDGCSKASQRRKSVVISMGSGNHLLQEFSMKYKNKHFIYYLLSSIRFHFLIKVGYAWKWLFISS